MKYAFSTHRKVLTNKDFIGNTLLLSKTRRLSDSVAEIRSRVKIVKDQNECLKITKHLIELGQPIGVDLEGNQQSPGLIQVRSNMFVGGKYIYLFRTGIRPALLYDGGIAKLLEHPKVLKIFCGADQDIGSLANANITLNSVFDISVAQKIIEYQNHGTLLYSMKSIRDEESKMLTTSFLGDLKSLRQICSDYGLKENDFASCFGGGRTRGLERDHGRGQRVGPDLVWCWSWRSHRGRRTTSSSTPATCCKAASPAGENSASKGRE